MSLYSLSVNDTIKITLSTSNAQSAIFPVDTFVVILPTVDCFVKTGANPTASDATGSACLVGGVPSPPVFVPAGHKLGLLGAGAGSAYITRITR